MSKILNIVIVILILAALVYGYMQFTSSPDTATPEGLSAESDTPTIDVGLTTQTQQNDFVSLLLDLKQISLDTEFLTSSVFTSLTDFSRDIIPQNVGRRNPFAPIGANAGVDERSTQVSAFITPASTTRTQTPPPQSDQLAPDQTPPPDESFLDGGL